MEVWLDVEIAVEEVEGSGREGFEEPEEGWRQCYGSSLSMNSLPLAL